MHNTKSLPKTAIVLGSILGLIGGIINLYMGYEKNYLVQPLAWIAIALYLTTTVLAYQLCNVWTSRWTEGWKKGHKSGFSDATFVTKGRSLGIESMEMWLPYEVFLFISRGGRIHVRTRLAHEDYVWFEFEKSDFEPTLLRTIDYSKIRWMRYVEENGVKRLHVTGNGSPL